MPAGWSQTAQLAYAFVTFKALGLLMSCGSIPYTALMPMVTAHEQDRLKLSGMRSIGTAVSVILATVGVEVLLPRFGGRESAHSFFIIALIFAGLSLTALAALIVNVKERHAAEIRPNFAIWPATRLMLRNRAWWVSFGFCFFYFIRFGSVMSLTPLFAKRILGAEALGGPMMGAFAIALLFSSLFSPALLARIGIRLGCTIALGSALLVVAIMPFFEGNVPLFLALHVVAALAMSVSVTASFTMIAQTIDYHDRKFGERNEGLLSAGISLATKIGMAVGSSVGGFALGIAGYNPDAVTDAAREAIRWSWYGWPIAMLAIQILVVWFWPMDGKQEAVPDDPDF